MEALRAADARHRLLWEWLGEPQRHPSREQALRHLLNARPEAPLPHLAEAQSVRLFGASEARAWIERRRQRLPEPGGESLTEWQGVALSGGACGRQDGGGDNLTAD